MLYINEYYCLKACRYLIIFNRIFLIENYKFCFRYYIMEIIFQQFIAHNLFIFFEKFVVSLKILQYSSYNLFFICY